MSNTSKFTDQAGHKVPGMFGRPKAAGKYPVVLLLHGLTSNKEQVAAMVGIPLGKHGCAILALDAGLHGERKAASAPKNGLKAIANVMHDSVLEYRQALDYLATRSDVDIARVGVAGYSMGAMTGTILTAVEPRIKAALLYVGGDALQPLVAALPAAERTKAETVSPAKYAPFMSPRPVMFVNGTTDTIMPRDAAERVQKAAKQPREIVWANAGHILPASEMEKGAAWLAKKLRASR